MTNVLPNVNKDDAMFVNALYHKPSREYEWEDMLEVVYKDLSTGEKYVHSVLNPTMDVYFTKPDYTKPFYQEAVPIEGTTKVALPYKDIEMAIAEIAGGNYPQILRENNRNRNRGANREIHKYPGVYGSDYDIEQWVRIQWLLNLNNDKPKEIDCLFLDIEADVRGMDRFVEPGERPVNAITVIDEKEMRSFTFLLRNEKNPLIQEFEDKIDTFIHTLHEMFDDTYGKLEYHIRMYDEKDELEMLTDLFRLINTLKRDFCLIWNMDFDIPYLRERIIALGGDPNMIMTHPDFKRRVAWYKKSNADVVQARDSRFVCSSYTAFECQMTIYSGMRKGQSELRSTALTAVGQAEIGDEKIDYSETSDIGELPYVDYWTFVLYGIKDVLLQMGIKKKTGDIENLYTRCYANTISYEKAFKQTKFIEDRGYVEYFHQGLIIGNNLNMDYTIPYDKRREMEADEKDEDESFSGGLVADPLLNGYHGIKIFGSPSRHIYNNVVDFDFSSMYPFIIITFNISRSSMVGKLIIDTDIEGAIKYAQELEDQSDKGRIFIEDYLTDSIASFGKKWFNLPDTKNVINLFEDKFKKKISSRRFTINEDLVVDVDIEWGA